MTNIKEKLKKDQENIVSSAIQACLPDAAVHRALKGLTMPQGKIVVISIGKAAWRMAKAAVEDLPKENLKGLVITKYGHSEGPIDHIEIREAGHPVLDENTIRGTELALGLVQDLTENDLVVFLISGGGSALFEKPLIPLTELEDINQQLLASGADIVEINTIRKRLSQVKGGKFALACAPAKVFSIILSDVLGDPVDMIASGPAAVDTSTAAMAKAIVEKYHINLSQQALALMEQEGPKELPHVQTEITGSVRQLAQAAYDCCRDLGYETHLLTTCMACQAKEAGALLGSIAATHQNDDKNQAFLFGGETVVKLTGNGKGGRNQELAIAAAEGIQGIPHALVFSFGSDGTDGPTDAAGGRVDADSFDQLKSLGTPVEKVLAENNAYVALERIGGLIKTGPTGTNVNDLAVVLLRGKNEAN